MVNHSAALKQLLGAAAWASGLSAEERAAVDAETHEGRFDAGAVVCREGAPAENWMGVIDGLLKVDSIDADGRSTTFNWVSGGGWIGEGSVIKGEPLRYEIVALTKSRVAFVSRAAFLRLLQTSLPFNHFIIAQLNARLGQFVALTACQRSRDTFSQVACCVAELFNPQLGPMPSRDIRISQEEIGRLCGCSRQAASRALHRLAREGLVQVHHRGIEVLDLAGLNRFVQVH